MFLNTKSLKLIMYPYHPEIYITDYGVYFVIVKKVRSEWGGDGVGPGGRWCTQIGSAPQQWRHLSYLTQRQHCPENPSNYNCRLKLGTLSCVYICDIKNRNLSYGVLKALAVLCKTQSMPNGESKCKMIGSF
eukprot:sb/3474985/